MHPPPPCRQLGPQCRALEVTLRIGALAEGVESLDQEATWLLGHTGSITFGQPYSSDQDLLVDAILGISCRHLDLAKGGGSCRAYGFQGPVLEGRPAAQPRRLPGDLFEVVQDLRRALIYAPAPQPEPRHLPVLAAPNPCSTAPCRTADHTRGSACCRDLQLEILCPSHDTELEALVRSRRSPYLCKISRERPESLGVEVISACGYLDDEGRGCTLHGRKRPDGNPAKPDLCSDWPPEGEGLHPGCVFRATGSQAAI